VDLRLVGLIIHVDPKGPGNLDISSIVIQIAYS